MPRRERPRVTHAADPGSPIALWKVTFLFREGVWRFSLGAWFGTYLERGWLSAPRHRALELR